MPTAFSAPSREQWMKYEHSPMAKQQEFIERYKDEFIKEPIDGAGSIRAGDCLVRKGIRCEHHMLCTGLSGDQVNIIEYTGPALSLSASSKSASFKDVTGKGTIAEQPYSVKDLLKNKVEKIIWPDKLRRFSVEEVISRARTRLGETRYDVLKNNCEHFVTWSMCGLKVSLQVKRWYIWAREVAYSTVAGVYNYIGKEVNEKVTIPLLIKLAANASDEVAGFVCKNAKYIGFVLAILMEAGLASYEILKAFNDHSQTSEEFKTKFVDVVAKAVCRLGFGIAGSLVGGMAGPWSSLIGGAIGGVVGGVIGAGLGHMIAAMITWMYENSSYVEG